MLILTETTDAIELVLDATPAANQPSFLAMWRDLTASGYTPGRSVGAATGTTTLDLVTGPAASTQRIIDYLRVVNLDTANRTITLKFDANGTETNICSIVLAPSESLEYVEGQGLRVLASNGAIKQTYSSGNNPISSARSQTVLASDVTNNNATANTIADVTGLSFAVTAGVRYYFRFVIRFTAAATTTGSRWSVSGPGSPTELSYESDYSLTTTTRTLNTGLGAYDLPAAANATSAATAGNTAIIEGFIKPSANGTVIARFASEVSSSAIVAKAGSFVEFQAL